MSTEHQRYSTENQAEAIAHYAARRGFEIVRTYEDSGKSGLRLEGRAALKRLIDDVTAGRADYRAILVYDISRWGRFQDADESAYYEYICREAGIAVQYCAEQFENDGSIQATIIKSVKRAMAGEYSRELSVKVFAGQCRLIRLGYRQGGSAGYGLRRQLIDERGELKAQLIRGEQKSLQTDRVVLIPGPSDEVETVRRLYRMFVVQRRSETQLAKLLNDEGVQTDTGGPWTRAIVHGVLTNEKYVGHNVFNRTSAKLKGRRIANDPEQWVRAEEAFPGIVDKDYFEAAQRIIEERARRFTDEQLLERLSALLAERGCLSGLIIDEVEDGPSSSVFRHRFGSLVRAYALIGYLPARDFRYIEANRTLRDLHPDVVEQVLARMREGGASVAETGHDDLFRVNEEITLSIVLARCAFTQGGALRWKVRFDTGLRPDLTVAVRMDEANRAARDYYVLPWSELHGHGSLRLAPENGILLDAFRMTTLDGFYRLAERSALRRAA